MSNKTPFGFPTPEDSPGFLLWQTTITWQRLIKKALEKHNISHAQFVIIALLLWFEKEDMEVTQVDIVRMSKLDKMTVSKSLKKLVGLGYVNRLENAEDTRAKTVSLTSPGKALVHELVPIVESIDAEFFGRLRNEDKHQLVKALRKLTVDVNG